MFREHETIGIAYLALLGKAQKMVPKWSLFARRWSPNWSQELPMMLKEINTKTTMNNMLNMSEHGVLSLGMCGPFSVLVRTWTPLGHPNPNMYGKCHQHDLTSINRCVFIMVGGPGILNTWCDFANSVLLPMVLSNPCLYTTNTPFHKQLSYFATLLF